MTDATFCDLHKTENNVVPKDRTLRIIFTRWDSALAQKVSRKNVLLQATLDACNTCANELLQIAKSHGVDIENHWKIEQLVAPAKGSKSKRWRTVLMSPSEWIEHVKKQQEEAEQIERQEQEPARVAPQAK